MSTINKTTGTKEDVEEFIEDQRANMTGSTYVSTPKTRPFSAGEYVDIFSQENDAKITVWYKEIGIDEDGETLYDMGIDE